MHDKKSREPHHRRSTRSKNIRGKHDGTSAIHVVELGHFLTPDPVIYISISGSLAITTVLSGREVCHLK